MTGRERWRTAVRSYAEVIADPCLDAHYLRTKLLQPKLLDLLGDVKNARLLDVGCGDGWLVTATKAKRAVECDIVRSPSFPRERECLMADVCSGLPFNTGQFDVVVGSLVLMFVENLVGAIAEMRRVVKQDGRLLVALVHPFFYRTGDADETGAFRVRLPLGRPWSEDVRINEATELIPYHYRPLPFYLQTFIDSGFSISRIADAYVDIDDYSREFGGRMGGNVLRTGHVPMYTFVELVNRGLSDAAHH